MQDPSGYTTNHPKRKGSPDLIRGWAKKVSRRFDGKNPGQSIKEEIGGARYLKRPHERDWKGENGGVV